MGGGTTGPGTGREARSDGTRMTRETDGREHEWTSVDPDKRYRYKYCWQLDGQLSRPDDVCLFLLLNPATREGDAGRIHRTRNRCKNFARRLGFGTLWTCNLFALRDPDPARLGAAGVDPVGPENDAYLRAAIREADMIVCAWGASGKSVGRRDFARRVDAVVRMIEDVKTHDELYALGDGLTDGGQPKHPARLREPIEAFRFRLRIRNGKLEPAPGT